MSMIVTGSSGFIGGHVCDALQSRNSGDRVRGVDLARPKEAPWYEDVPVDIRDAEALQRIHVDGPPSAVIHLAAEAEVLTPWSEVPPLLSTNIQGTFHVANVLNPRTIVFASTSAVYGNAELSQSRPAASVSPLSLYAVSKLTGEMILRDWARETNGSAVAFRFGNVIGAGCRGLIPFLIEHIHRHPDGKVPARMRGGGKLIRDYVPVQYVVEAMIASVDSLSNPGTLEVLNIGTGLGIRNGEIAEAVQRAVARKGFTLTCTFDDPPGPGEANEVVLDMNATARRLGLQPPGRDRIFACAEESALRHLKVLCGSL